MAQLTATAARAASPIESLPVEILEQILLYVIADVKPPIIGRKGCDKLYRCAELPPSHVQDSLAFRRCSRRIWSSSWRALGRFIGETVFDLRSRKSFENLLAVSACEKLAPWVQKLTIGCHQPDPGYPENWSLGPYWRRGEDTKDIDRKIAEIKDQDEKWYSGLWSRSDYEATGRTIPVHPQYDEDFGALQRQLTKVLSSLKNLDNFHYYHVAEVPPGRYHELFHQAEERPELDTAFDEDVSGYIAHTGFEIFMGAMKQSGVRISTMELAVDLDEHCAFITRVPAAVVGKVFESVQSLNLRSAYYPFFDDDGNPQINEPRLVLDKSLLPALRALTVDHDEVYSAESPRVASLPQGPDALTLDTLIILGLDYIEPTMIEFLRSFVNTLRHLTFDCMALEDYTPLFRAIKHLNLETLEVPHQGQDFWPDYLKEAYAVLPPVDGSDTWKLLDILPEDEFQWLLTDVKLGPPAFREALKHHGDARRRANEVVTSIET